MSMRWQRIGIILLLLALAISAGGCGQKSPVEPTPLPPTPAPTYTPWIVVVTATPGMTTAAETPQAPGTPAASVSPAATRAQTAGAPTPTTTYTPLPLPTARPITPEPNKPVVLIITPADNSQFIAGQAVQVQFSAADQGGVARAELYVNGTLAAYRDYPKWPTYITNDTLIWQNAVAGNYTIALAIYDTSHNTSKDQRAIVVQRQATQPQVRLDSPTQRVVIVAGQQIQIQATMLDVVDIQGISLVERKGGQEVVYTTDPAVRSTPFGWQVTWYSEDVGDHVLFVRVRDVNGGVGQSPDFTIGVADNNPPAVQPSYSATALTEGSDLLVHVEAMDSKGIILIRLVVDGREVNAWNAPDQRIGQDHVSVQLRWSKAGPGGDHTAYVFAQDTKGNRGQSPNQGIRVLSQPPTATPIPTATPAPPTPTPRPAPPRVSITEPQNGFQGSMIGETRFTVNASGGAPLDRIELYGALLGQGSPHILHSWPAGGQTNFAGSVNWGPSNAGNWDFFARVYDTTGQYSQSNPVSGVILPPAPAPTAAPTPTQPPAPTPVPTRPPAPTPVPTQPLVPTPVPAPTQPPAPTLAPKPSFVGKFGGEAGERFIILISGQQGNKLHGSVTLEDDGQTETIMDSNVEGNRVTIEARFGAFTYNFMLTLSGDGQRLEGDWSTSATGVPMPITFQRLFG